RLTRGKLAIIGGSVGTWCVVMNFVPTVHDPTEDTRLTQVVNDRQAPVSIGLCAHQSCRHLAAGTEALAPDEDIFQNAGPHSITSFLVANLPGGDPVCRALLVGDVVHARYRLSDLQPCA